MSAQAKLTAIGKALRQKWAEVLILVVVVPSLIYIHNLNSRLSSVETTVKDTGLPSIPVHVATLITKQGDLEQRFNRFVEFMPETRVKLAREQLRRDVAVALVAARDSSNRPTVQLVDFVGRTRQIYRVSGTTDLDRLMCGVAFSSDRQAVSMEQIERYLDDSGAQYAEFPSGIDKRSSFVLYGPREEQITVIRHCLQTEVDPSPRVTRLATRERTVGALLRLLSGALK